MSSSTPEGERISLRCDVDGVVTEGYALRKQFTFQERVFRTIRVFGILMLIGVGTVVVPLLHFILPPLFMLAACIFGTTTWLETSEVIEGEIACPNCKFAIKFPREAEEWPKVQRCGGCSFTLKIEKI